MGVCKVCEAKCQGDYCFRHKPKKPLKRTPIKKSSKKKTRTYKKATKKPLSPYDQAKQDLWDIFSKYVRLRDSDDDGYCTCISCPERFFWKYGDCGHFVGRKAMATWIHEKNNHAQCKSCNQKHEGRKWEYGKALDKMYGEGTADEITLISRGVKKYSLPEFKSLEEHYKKQVERLKKQKKLR